MENNGKIHFRAWLLANFATFNDAAKALGVSYQAVQAWSVFDRFPNKLNLRRIRQLAGVAIDYDAWLDTFIAIDEGKLQRESVIGEISAHKKDRS